MENGRIVFTGATGSLGSQMPGGPHALKTRLESSEEEMLRELQELPFTPRAFLHLAGLVRVDECEKDPARAHALNVEGSLKWFRAAVKAGCTRFVFVSSAHVFAPPRDREPITLHSPVEARSVYAKTKLEAETELRMEASRVPGMRLSIARIFSLLSRRMRPGFLLTGLHDRAKKRDFSPIPGLDYTRDFIDAADACQALVRLATIPSPPELALICSGTPRKVREIAEEVFREHGLDPRQLVAAPGRPSDIPYLVGEPTLL